MRKRTRTVVVSQLGYSVAERLERDVMVGQVAHMEDRGWAVRQIIERSPDTWVVVFEREED